MQNQNNQMKKASQVTRTQISIKPKLHISLNRTNTEPENQKKKKGEFFNYEGTEIVWKTHE